MCKYSQRNLNTFARSAHQRAGGAAVPQLSARKYSNWALNTYTFIAQKWRFFSEKNSKIAWLMSFQRWDLQKTLKYSQSWDLEGIQWILWIHTDAAPANSSKTAEGTNFKFGRRVPRESPDMTLTNLSEKWAWSRSRDPVNFWALNANSSKMAKVTNF